MHNVRLTYCWLTAEYNHFCAANKFAGSKHRLKTKAGKAIYALRKITSEPIFGIIKAVVGFRSFMLRGKESAAGEWNLACMAYNIKMDA